ncbi:hypothetical protein BDV27DRAFT_160064 [Aspergillus caelatus]|uniref:Nucleoside phosphorylase domain-containing protein n=1 Tax=Aspergillus caelatus TaxID=61420 RepID=A0A5N6ZX57_9EURO|nr:uncharacterized protein BDV27DRAFT_160064 [Aspergillus caelatus]KAE8362102.1 hypothetical protein BDV27DRAFT_160064 [Aspergillus caelatus]
MIAYTVGWGCALDCELHAARALPDQEGEPLEPALHDGNLYLLGRFEQHNVVITSTSGYGTNSATQAVTNLIRSFPNIRLGLMVGIGGAYTWRAGSHSGSLRKPDRLSGTGRTGRPSAYAQAGRLSYNLKIWTHQDSQNCNIHAALTLRLLPATLIIN